MAVFRASLLEPSAVIAHEIPEPPDGRVPGVLDESREARRDRLGHLRDARGRKEVREQQCPGVVVDTVAVGAIRYRMGGVLEHSGAVAERQKMPDLQVGNVAV